MKKFCVIGGGLSGLEFARHAASLGNEVVVYEAGPQVRKKHVHSDTQVLAGDEKSSMDGR